MCNRRILNYSIFAAVAFMIAGCGCLMQRLGVESYYVTIDDLASMHVNTPDPRQSRPPQGQRLMISWSVAKATMHYYGRLFLSVRVIFGNHEEGSFSIPIEKHFGTYTYSLLNEDYFSKGGLLSYKVELWGDNELIEEWRHQIWTEIIRPALDCPSEVGIEGKEDGCGVPDHLTECGVT